MTQLIENKNPGLSLIAKNNGFSKPKARACETRLISELYRDTPVSNQATQRKGPPTSPVRGAWGICQRRSGDKMGPPSVDGEWRSGNQSHGTMEAPEYFGFLQGAARVRLQPFSLWGPQCPRQKGLPGRKRGRPRPPRGERGGSVSRAWEIHAADKAAQR
jgi:hypothetical protein